MKTCLLSFILAFTTLSMQAQRVCGSVDYKNQQIQQNPALAANYQLVEAQIQAELQRGMAARDTSSNELINIPVVVHVVYNTAEQNISAAQIQSQIDVLNRDYSYTNTDNVKTPSVFKQNAADTRIHFCLAQVDPQGHATNGIDRVSTGVTYFTANDAVKFSGNGGANAWDCKKYLNIWVCRMFGGTLGYASAPGSPANVDGVVINYTAFGTIGVLSAKYNKGRTATHEIGHWLGLRHIWGDTDCGDDGIDDTPRQLTYNYGTPTFPHVTSCSQTANGDMFMNYMDYSDDAAMNMFTVGQKKRMRALFANGNIRNSFLTSFACDSTLAQAGPLPVTTTPTVTPDATTATLTVKVYPNPAHGLLNIESLQSSDKLIGQTINIYSITGVKMISTVMNAAKSNINISTLAVGFYIVEIGQGADKFVTKIVKN